MTIILLYDAAKTLIMIIVQDTRKMIIIILIFDASIDLLL